MIQVHLVGSGPDSSVDVIFLHGLEGGWRSTWSLGSTDGAWPQWLATDLPELAVWCVDYPASATRWRRKTMPIRDRATSLFGALADAHHIGDRPFILVGHSLGGLLIKQMIRHSITMRDQYAHFTDRLAGVIFFSTPHTGSGIASLASYLKLVRTTPLVEELTKNQASLRDLDDWYRNYAVESKLPTLSFFEKENTKRIRVVDESSGDPHLPGVTAIPVDADHRTICKFSNRHSPIYLQVREFITAHEQRHPHEPIAPPPSRPAIANVPTPSLSPGTTESADEPETLPRETLGVESAGKPDSAPVNSEVHQVGKLVTEWIASTLVNHRIHFSRFQFSETQDECTAEASQLGLNDRAMVSVTVTDHRNAEYTLTVKVSSTRRGMMLSRATRLPHVRFDQSVVIFLTRDLWPELALSLDYLRDL